MAEGFNCDEPGRLRALGRLEVLDTPAERPFESIVDLIREVLQVPICAVSLIDADRQWFKASRGLSVSQTPRDISFCTHTIQGRTPFVICDAKIDIRFMDNPLVIGDPYIRSYAGIPLLTPDGYNIGSLCAIDTKARNFLKSEISLLEKFAKLVIDEIELRRIVATDALTGAMSRRSWFETARGEVLRAARYRRPLSFIIIDIDNFKKINDRFGHAVGDLVLTRLTQIALEQLRQSDAFGRLGGEEFVAALPETQIGEAIAIAERLCETFRSEPFVFLNREHCTISIGVSELRLGEHQLEPALERADKALYQAKAAGRDRTQMA